MRPASWTSVPTPPAWDRLLPGHHGMLSPRASSPQTREFPRHQVMADDDSEPCGWHRTPKDWRQQGCSFLDLQNGPGNHKVDDQPGGVYERGNKWVGEHRRVNINGPSNQWHNPTNTRRHPTNR